MCFPGFYPNTFDDPTGVEQTDFGMVRKLEDESVVNVVIESSGNVKISTSHSVNVSGAVVNVNAGKANVVTSGDTDLEAGGDTTITCVGNMLMVGTADATFYGEGSALLGSDGMTYLYAVAGSEPVLKGDKFCTLFDAHKHVCPILGMSGIVDSSTDSTTDPDIKSTKVNVGG